MADIILDIGKDFFAVLDFKTNKNFRFYSAFNEYFYEPLDHLSVCEFNSYGMQLSLYSYMYSKLTGRKCVKQTVLYVVNGKFVPINLNYMKAEVQAMLESSVN